MQGPAVMQSLDFGCLIESTPPDKLGARSLLNVIGRNILSRIASKEVASINPAAWIHSRSRAVVLQKIQRHDFPEDTQKQLHVDWRKSCGQIQVDLMLKQVVPHHAPTGDWAGRSSLSSRGKKGKRRTKKKGETGLQVESCGHPRRRIFEDPTFSGRREGSVGRLEDIRRRL